MNPEVTTFLTELKHPLIAEIEYLRELILSCDKNISENIKWNGPNYMFKDEDRITMKINPPKKIQLILHRGAKKQAQPKAKLISNTSKLLDWKENDRAVITFQNLPEIQANSEDLKKIIKDWVKATS